MPSLSYFGFLCFSLSLSQPGNRTSRRFTFAWLYPVIHRRNHLSRLGQKTKVHGKGEIRNFQYFEDSSWSIYHHADYFYRFLMGGSGLSGIWVQNLAQLAGVPEELIGFTLLAIGTSLPELAASISLLRKGETSMLLGNIVGSNLFNISLIGGLAGLMGPVRNGSPNPWIDYLFLLIITFLFTFWLKGKTLNKKEGILLLLIYSGACGSTWLLNS